MTGTWMGGEEKKGRKVKRRRQRRMEAGAEMKGLRFGEMWCRLDFNCVRNKNRVSG